MSYMYITNHGLGNSCPTEGLVETKCLPNGKTILYYDRVLTPQELDYYDIKNEWEK